MRVFRTMLAEVTVGNLFFAILALLGTGVLWWDARLNPYRLFVIGFTLSSVAALWPGMYFRHHYFVFVAPVVALLAGVAVSRCLYLLGRDLSIELLLTPPTLVLFGAAVIYAAVIHGPVWLASSPTDASKLIYRSSIFADSLEVARFLEQATTPSQKVAVLGSEPQIYFYSRRRAATGHIYMYPLMETHPYAAKMQEELVRELEAAQPEFVVFINMHTSWLRRPESERRIFDWWTAYSKTNYMLVRVFTPTSSTGKWDPEKFLPYLLGDYSIPAQLLVRTVQPNETVPLAIHVYKRRPSAP
ncbi:MAG: hypothetical protein RMH97_03990 [Verrucomicrobiales bacterium]|nr:hypothetical protein [Verrucomicrobiales bacterium]